jgi:hypothetical protein
MYRLVPTVRGGSTNSPLIARRHDSVDEARAAAKQLMHENSRVVRVAIVVDDLPGRFVEFIERA